MSTPENEQSYATDEVIDFWRKSNTPGTPEYEENIRNRAREFGVPEENIDLPFIRKFVEFHFRLNMLQRDFAAAVNHRKWDGEMIIDDEETYIGVDQSALNPTIEQRYHLADRLIRATMRVLDYKLNYDEKHPPIHMLNMINEALEPYGYEVKVKNPTHEALDEPKD